MKIGNIPKVHLIVEVLDLDFAIREFFMMDSKG